MAVATDYQVFLLNDIRQRSDRHPVAVASLESSTSYDLAIVTPGGGGGQLLVRNLERDELNEHMGRWSEVDPQTKFYVALATVAHDTAPGQIDLWSRHDPRTKLSTTPLVVTGAA